MASIGFKDIGSKAGTTVAQMKPTTPVWMTNSKTSAKKFARYSAKDKSYDVAVIGAGIFGVTTAYLLKEAGKKVVLLEARQIGSGTTGSSTAKLSAQQQLAYSTINGKHGVEIAKKYGKMQLDAIAETESIIKKLGIDCEWSRKPSYTWTSDKSKVSTVHEEYRLMKENFGWDAEYIQGSPTSLPKSIECLAAAKLPDQVEFNPYAFCVGVASAVDGSGCTVHEESRVVDITANLTEDHCVELAGGSKVIATNIVLATHMPILDRSGHFGVMTASRSHCVLFKLSQPVLDGMYVSAEEPIKSLRVVDGGKQLLVSGQSMPQGKDVNTNEYYAEIEEWTRKHFPVTEVTGKWSAMDYFSGDHVPYIGQLHRGCQTIYTATGFSKWGLTNGVAAAKIVRDSIIKEANDAENEFAAFVDARRWDLTKTLGTILEENMHVTKHMIGDKLKTFIAPAIETLKRGEGGLVKSKKGTVGAYIDDDGKCHAVNPVCTHLGCNLNFNQGDLCWDCPCHGSRFDTQGEVVHGPATKPLEKVDIDW